MPKIMEPAKRLRIYLCEEDRFGEKSTYQQIVQQAKKLDLQGATVLRGLLGYGASSRIHTAKIVALSCDLPIIVEIVDSAENINKLLPYLDENMKEGLITIDDVEMIKYGNMPSNR